MLGGAAHGNLRFSRAPGLAAWAAPAYKSIMARRESRQARAARTEAIFERLAAANPEPKGELQYINPFAVIEPQITEPKPEPAVEEEKPETAAKEKILEPDEATTQESTTATEVLPLAAESVEPIQETALPSALSPTIEVPAEVKGDEITIRQGDRRYRVRGLAKNMSYELLKVNVLVYREPSESASSTNESGFHVDTLDLYAARQRTVFIKQAAKRWA